MTDDVPATRPWSGPRVAALVVALAVGAMALVAVLTAATTSSDAAGNAMAEAVAVIASAVAVLFALPALGLALAGWSKTALGFAVVAGVLMAGLVVIMA